MHINFLSPMSCGNAVRMILTPTVGVTQWRVLRNETGVFANASDPAAFIVSDGSERTITDFRLLVNGVVYFYAIYELVAGVWGAPAIRSATPLARFEDMSVDPQEVVRERLELALQSLIQRGKIVLTKPSIPVMSIPFYSQGSDLPVVTVLYGSGSAVLHAIGDGIGSDMTDGESFTSFKGWHDSVTLEVSAWSLNAQERNVLRRALEAAIAVNLEVFIDAGLMMPEVQSIQDSEDTQAMNAPVYQTVIRFGCQVAVSVTEVDGVIKTVISDYI